MPDPMHRLCRLAQLSLAEIRVRVQQGLAKRYDRVRYGIFPTASRGRRDSRGLSGNFFFSPAELPKITELITSRLPHTLSSIIEQANKICAHEFDLLGYRNLDFGDPIDWHLDPVHGKRSPRKLWFKIRYLDFAEVGDIKVTWELNRHQHLVTLAKAHVFTGQERYVTELVRQWYHWQEANRYPFGVNWSSTLEVAFRSMSWVWMAQLLQNSPALPKTFLAEIEDALHFSGRYIERYLSTFFSPNTHLLGEGAALFFLGTVLPSCPITRRWQSLGWRIICAQASRQVQADGFHFEQSTYYHVYALDFFLHSIILAQRNGIRVPTELEGQVIKMLEALASLAQAGPPPRIGDDDGGRLFDPQRNRAEHFLDPLATGAALFGRPGFKAVQPELVEETVWLLGTPDAERLANLSCEVPYARSVALHASGLYVMTNSAKPEQQLVIDVGPQGTGTAGHGHADALNLQLAIAGEEFLTDPGAFAYVTGDKERARFRGTSAHNTLCVDGQDQAEAGESPFSWRSLPEVRAELWRSGTTFDLLRGAHTGYHRLAAPVSHRRWVFHQKPSLWVVLDRVEGRGSHQLALNWHFAPQVVCELRKGGALARSAKGTLVMLASENHGWDTELGDYAFSPVYGMRENAQVVRFQTQAGLPASFVTLLAVGDRKPVTGTLSPLQVETAQPERVHGFHYSVGLDTHSIVFSEGRTEWRIGGLVTDAAFLDIGHSVNGGSQALVICEASRISLGGRSLLAGQGLDYFESRSRGSEVEYASLSDFEFLPLIAELENCPQGPLARSMSI